MSISILFFKLDTSSLQKLISSKNSFGRTNGGTGKQMYGVTWSLLELLIAAKRNLNKS